MKEQKKLLRKQIKEEKKNQHPDLLMMHSVTLFEQIEKHPRFIASNTLLLYHSLGDEVQTHAFVEKWHTSKKILLPVVKGDILVLRPYTGKEELKAGAFNIEEPTGEDFTNYQEIELSIIPGVSFDREGNRLGRGKGYYDKLLPLLSSIISRQESTYPPNLSTKRWMRYGRKEADSSLYNIRLNELIFI